MAPYVDPVADVAVLVLDPDDVAAALLQLAHRGHEVDSVALAREHGVHEAHRHLDPHLARTLGLRGLRGLLRPGLGLAGARLVVDEHLDDVALAGHAHVLVLRLDRDELGVADGC
jgi:hypothetical protein